MNKENAIKKINTIGKVGSIISTICLVVTCIGIVCAILGGVVTAVLPKNLFTITFNDEAVMNIDVSTVAGETFTGLTDLNTGSLGQGTMSVNGETYTPDSVETNGDQITAHYVGGGGILNSARVSIICWTAVVFGAISAFLLFLVKRICNGLKACESPFEESIIKNVELCSLTLIPWGIMGGITSNVVTSAFSASVKFGPSFSLSNVLVILLLFGLGFIFKYGAYLQTESDETL